METSTTAASTLTRSRLSLAIISAAAAASTGYFLYRALTEPPHQEPSAGSRLHRSNAVRRRHRSASAAYNLGFDHDDEEPHEPHDPSLLNAHLPDRRRDSESSYTSEESHGDENADVTIRAQVVDGETVNNDEHLLDDDWFNDPAQAPRELLQQQSHHHHAQQNRAGQNIVSLLFRVSEDNARRNAYVHRGCQCNACGIAPIRGVRYRCANCADFDLCETCESQGLHIKTHIFYKVKVPAPPFGPRQMQPVWYPGDPETCLRNLPRQQIVKLSKETGFERPELEAFWEQWTFMANTEWREDPDDLYLAMDRRTFERCLVPSGGYRYTAPNLIHDRMFAFYDTNNDDLISFREFLIGLSYRKQRNKLKKIFEGYDIDRDGLVCRRDFLRIFRAYYVLYKQMHKDILEGLDDQVMSSTEAHQLVSSRQPLSSLFGREGRVPDAHESRHMEGKIFHGNGEITVSDGKTGVVNEDKPDTSDRDAILSSLFTKNPENLFSPLLENENSEVSPGLTEVRYWNGLLNPPTRVDELPALLNGEPRPGDELFVPQREDEVRVNGQGPQAQMGQHILDDINGAENSSSGNDSNRENINDLARPSITPAEAFTDRIPTESQLRAQHQRRSQRVAAMNRKNRATARRRLLERWKRRRFYLDEEEGAIPPDGWDDNEDVLNDLDGMPESSKSHHAAPLSPRSRSSSKVRFAEDDDYEIRSNPSTSSRSVPERWGGMDIPDAERDAGKEVLYQVTQQAFNELLDILFKKKEDLAIRAAQTKDDRNRFRHLFENIDLTEVDKKTEAPPQENGEELSAVNGGHQGDRPLEDLLRISGYTVDEFLAIGQATIDRHNEIILEIGEEIMNEMLRNPDLVSPRTRATRITTNEPAESDREVEEYDVASWTAPVEPGHHEDRDPTMPQFRPNSEGQPAQTAETEQQLHPPAQNPADDDTDDEEPDSPTSRASRASSSALPTPSSSSLHSRPKVPAGASSSGTANEKDEEKPKTTNNGATAAPDSFPTHQLIEWKRLDVAEQEAKARGGWGRLDFAEFEEIYKREETEGNRLDYLGSWIDFCIP